MEFLQFSALILGEGVDFEIDNFVGLILTFISNSVACKATLWQYVIVVVEEEEYQRPVDDWRSWQYREQVYLCRWDAITGCYLSFYPTLTTPPSDHTFTMYKIPNIWEHFYIILSDDPQHCTVKLEPMITRIRSYLDNPWIEKITWMQMHSGLCDGVK